MNEDTFEEMAKRLAVPDLPPGYLSVAPPLNREIRRKAKLEQKRQRRQRERWWLRMERLGFDPAALLAEKRRKAEERGKVA